MTVNSSAGCQHVCHVELFKICSETSSTTFKRPKRRRPPASVTRGNQRKQASVCASTYFWPWVRNNVLQSEMHLCQMEALIGVCPCVCSHVKRSAKVRKLSPVSSFYLVSYSSASGLLVGQFGFPVLQMLPLQLTCLFTALLNGRCCFSYHNSTFQLFTSSSGQRLDVKSRFLWMNWYE